MSSSNCGQNVVDYHGADPTGSTDSTDAFLRAIGALGSRGGIVAIPAGRYRIDGAPISVRTPVCFRGAWGIERTGRDWSGSDWRGVPLAGSTTTLVFPHDRDGFVVEPNTRVGFENLALVRNRQDPTPFARRGIHAKGPIYADSLYLVHWERGIHLDGRKTHPDQPQDLDGYNVNGSRVERIFAEDCLWGTYTQGDNAQGCHFLYVYCLSCGAGIYDSSLGGNGYVNCYVEQPEVPTEPPYYIDNQSVLFNCRCEHKFPPQLGGSAQAIGGAFNVNASPALRAVLGIVDPNPQNAGFRQINGVPGRIVSKLFKTSGFIGGEQIDVTVDGQTRVITFSAADQSPVEVAARINAGFPANLPRVAYADVFASTLCIEGWRGHGSGSVNVAGTPIILAQIGFPAAGVSGDALGVGQLLARTEISNAIFLGHSGPGGTFGSSEQVQVQVAPRGDVPLLWQAIGADADPHELSVIRLRDADARIRRWAFARASAEMLTTLAFTMNGDPLGEDQVVMYRGVWLQSSVSAPAVLLCNGKPSDDPSSAQGRPGDIAWDMADSPPTRYVRGAGGWMNGRGHR